MFTGLITGVGTLIAIKKNQYTFQCPNDWLGDSALGDSIAVNGACLTVVEINPSSFSTDISAETIRCCSPFKLNDKVNLEQSLQLGDKLGGHFVTGHIDGLGVVDTITPTPDSGCDLTILVNESLLPTISPKGSVTLAGVSLTVNDVSDKGFKVHLIPQTLSHTTLQYCQKGDSLNIEIDLFARYLQNLLRTKQTDNSSL